MAQLPDGSFLYRQAYNVSSNPPVYVLLRPGSDPVNITLTGVTNSSLLFASRTAVDFTADHARIVFYLLVGGAQELRTYDIATATMTTVPLGAGLGSYSVCVPGTDLLATASYQTLEFVSTTTGARTAIPLGSGVNPQSIAVSPDGATVYVGVASAPYIKAFTVATQTPVATALAAVANTFTGGYQERMPISPDGACIASLDASLRGVYVRRVSDGTTLLYKAYPTDVRWLSFNTSSSHFAVGVDNQTVELYRTSDFTLVKTYTADPTNGPGGAAWFVSSAWLSTAGNTSGGLGSGYDKRVIDALSGASVFTYDMDASSTDFVVPPAYLPPAAPTLPFWTHRVNTWETL